MKCRWMKPTKLTKLRLELAAVQKPEDHRFCFENQTLVLSIGAMTSEIGSLFRSARDSVSTLANIDTVRVPPV